MTNLIIQLISGAVGGIGAGKVMPKFSLGTALNVVAGLVGGGLGGQILGALGVSTGGAEMDIAGILGNVASGGVGGGALLAIVGVIKGLIKK